jgi:probable phosphoglycerate mutase
MPEGERLIDVQERALAAVEEIRRTGGETVLIAAHDAVIKVLLCAWMEMPLSGFWRFQVGNGSVTVVEDSPTGLRMSLMGDTCHLGDPFHRPDQAGL